MEIPDLKQLIERDKDDEFDRMVVDFKNKTFLTKKELLRMADWKFYRLWPSKHKKEIESNPDILIEKTTKRAIEEIDDKNKVEILDDLRGVGIPMASAILTVLNPNDYGVIDINAWYALNSEEKRSFTSEDFILFMKKIRENAKKQNLTARQTEIGLFKWGQERRGKNRKEKNCCID